MHCQVCGLCGRERALPVCALQPDYGILLFGDLGRPFLMKLAARAPGWNSQSIDLQLLT